MLEVPKVYWSDVGGQGDIKQRLKESVEWPLQVKYTNMLHKTFLFFRVLYFHLSSPPNLPP